MMFGLANAPVIFMDLMNRVCRPLLDKSVIVFTDDILIYLRSIEEHRNHLKEVLDILQSEKIYAKFYKCNFWLWEVKFLGHIVSINGVKVDPAKIEDIKKWESPKTLTEIRSFSAWQVITASSLRTSRIFPRQWRRLRERSSRLCGQRCRIKPFKRWMVSCAKHQSFPCEKKMKILKFILTHLIRGWLVCWWNEGKW